MNTVLKCAQPCFILAAVLGVAHAADPNDEAVVHQDASTNVEPLLEKLDRNQDGVVDLEEAGSQEGLREAFDRADTNRDGGLDSTELSQFLAPAVPPERPEKKPSADR